MDRVIQNADYYPKMVCYIIEADPYKQCVQCNQLTGIGVVYQNKINTNKKQEVQLRPFLSHNSNTERIAVLHISCNPSFLLDIDKFNQTVWVLPGSIVSF